MRISFAVALCGALLLANVAGAQFKAGVAYRDVTPEKLLPISGGMGPSQPAKEVKGRLTVRALVLSNDDTTVAICSTDFLGFPAALISRAHAKVSGIPAENLIVGATHAHSAPDMYGFPDEKGQFTTDLAYIDFVVNNLADAINEAKDKLQPATVKIATDKAQGKIAYNYYAPQLYDPRCSVIQFLGADGKPFATLVNYATHPEVLGPDRGILSPDLVGPLYERILEKGGGIGVFMNSAQGGMVTADNRGENGGPDVQTWDECVRIGHLLADEALRIVESAPIQENPGLFCTSKTVTFPVESEEIRMVAKLSPVGLNVGDDGKAVTRVNLVNLGDAQILTIPGEALPNIGYYLKRNMKGKHNLLFGLTNDAFGYILTKVDFDSFDRYRYITRTSLGEMTGEIYIDEALALVNANPGPTGVSR